MTPPDTAAGIQDAARHLAEGRPADAAGVLERLVREFPAYVTAHVLLAKAREASGRPAEALDAWHAAYFLMPGSPLVVRERARLLRGDAPANGVPTTAAPPKYVEEEMKAKPAAPVAEPQAPEPQEPEAEAADAVEAEVMAPEEPEREESVPDVPAEEATDAAPDVVADEVPEPAPEAQEPEPPGVATGPVVGGETDAWVQDLQPSVEPEAFGFEGSDTDTGEDDWKIIEETTAPRSRSSEPVEPTIAPPLGHGTRRAAFSSAHDVSQPGRFVDEDLDPDLEAPVSPGAATTPEADDLDALIQQLENAPRIRPDLNVENDDPDAQEPDAGELVSETLARIYAAQRQYDEAARAYEQLASKHPGRATELLGKAAEMRRAAETNG